MVFDYGWCGSYVCAGLLSKREGNPSKGGCICTPLTPPWIRHCYSVSLFWPSQHHHPRRRRQRRKPKPSHQPISSLNPVSSSETVGSLCVQKDTTTNHLPTSFPLKAHLEIKTASTQADSELIAVEDSDPEETNLTSSHSAMEDSQAFDSEEAAKQTCPSPNIDTESECEEVNLKSCLDVHYEKRDGVHGVLVHDKKGE